MSLFGIGSRYYRGFRNSLAVSWRRTSRRVFGKRDSVRNYKRYYLGRYNGSY